MFTRLLATWVGLVSAALPALCLSIITPTEGFAQLTCEAAPRLLVEPAACSHGVPCQIRVLLEAGGNQIPSISGAFLAPPQLALGEMAVGSCASNGALFGASPSFVVSDLSPPLGPFCDGPVLIAAVTCTEVGSFELGLDRVFLGTAGGQIVSGACGAGGLITCTAPASCGDGVIGVGEQCDDGNTVDGDCCSSTCQLIGGACDDGNACTIGDTCDAGACRPGAALVCNDGNGCTDDRCESISGCVFANNTAPCSDGNACTTGDTCGAGACRPGAALVCNDGNGCTDDTCSPATGCVFTNNTAPCNDGNACTTGDTCGAGACRAGAALVCTDGNGCTDDTCSPATGCVFSNNTAPCDDGNSCTAIDQCSGGICVGSGGTACDDGNPCTDDSCDVAGGCIFTNNAAPCDDGNACTTGDTCGAGACRSGTALVCDDGNGCTDDTCSPATGCVFTNNTAPCDDGNSCTAIDQCSGGICVGSGGTVCDDGNPCTDDGCDVAGGCVFTNNTAPCDDGDACTQGDLCGGGSCQSGSPLACDDGNICTTDTCQAGIGCVFTVSQPDCPVGPIPCDAAPRLIVGNTTCTIGLPCRISVAIEGGGAGVVSVAGRFTGESIVCTNTCQAAAGLPTMECGAQAGTCDFSLAAPVGSSAATIPDGELLTAEVSCTTEGPVDVGIDAVRLVDRAELAIVGACAVSGRVLCVPPSCGNGLLEPGEECDAGAANSDVASDACRTDCRAAHCGDGVLDSAEQCDLGDMASPTCCDGACRLESAGTPCRTAAGICDRTETCTGSSAHCPADELAGAEVECRASTGECDPAEACSGADVDCPGDSIAFDGSTCANGVCSQGLCIEDPPANSCVALSLPSGTVCRADRDCTLSVSMNDGGFAVASVTAQISDATGMICPACVAGAAAGNGDCTVVDETCGLRVVDVAPPVTSLADGEIAEVTIRCQPQDLGHACITPVAAFAPDGFTEHPTCEPSCVAYTCGSCVAGDCDRNEQQDDGDTTCAVRCMMGSASQGADCGCGADCNCLLGTEASDITCTVLRSLGSFGRLTGDTCDLPSPASLRLVQQAAQADVRVRVGKTRPTRSRRRSRAFVILRGTAAGQVGALRVTLSTDGGGIGPMRLTQRLAKAGFDLQVDQRGPHNAVAVIVPPTMSPLPGVGRGRALRVVVADEAAGLAVGRAELGSTTGFPMAIVGQGGGR